MFYMRLVLVFVIFVVIQLLIYIYYVPTRKLFRMRYWIDPMISGIWFASLLTMIKYDDALNTNIANVIGMFAIYFVIYAAFMFFMTSWSYRWLKKRTPLTLMDDEEEIISDSGVYMDEDVRKKGRLIMTNKRICFISEDKEHEMYTLEKEQLMKGVELKKKGPVVRGILIKSNEGDINLFMKYAEFWLREIKVNFGLN